MSDNDYEEDDEFYDEDEGDCLLRDEGLYGEMYARGRGDNRDYERDTSCDGFPPKISSYVRADTHNQLGIVFNYGRDKAWRMSLRWCQMQTISHRVKEKQRDHRRVRKVLRSRMIHGR
jgi:hypothetical protein